MTVPTPEERGAFKLAEAVRVADLHPGVKELLATERHATVDRIRKQLTEATPRGSMGVDWLVLLRVLDEEANGR